MLGNEKRIGLVNKFPSPVPLNNSEKRVSKREIEREERREKEKRRGN
jgi:hypothetical protein